MFKKAILLSFLTALSGMSAYAGLLDDFREDTLESAAFAIRLEERIEEEVEDKPLIKPPHPSNTPLIAPSASRLVDMLNNLHSIFFVPFPELSDAKDLRKILPGDMAWQVLDNFKIPAQNVGVSFLSQHYFEGEEKGIELMPPFKFLYKDLNLETQSKKVLAGIFHPTLKNNDVSQQGGWDKLWPVRLLHQSGKIVSPHQIDEFSLSYNKREDGEINLTSPDKIAIKGLPLLKQGQTASLWSLTIDNETHQAEVTFHLLVNDADHKILDEMCTNASSLKLKELPSYLEEKKFGWVPNNTHLQVLKRLFQN